MGKGLAKKIVLLSMSLLIFGFGCKGLTAQQQAAIKPVSLEYWTVFDDVDALQKQIDAFKLERPYITVNLKQLRPEEVYPRLVEALADDKGPDIISIRNRSVGQYLTKLAPMPSAIVDTLVKVTKTTLGSNTSVTINTLPAFTPAQLDAQYVQTVRKDVVRGEGKIYGLPLSLDTMAIYYNKDLLDRAGIATPPKTWDEFQEDVKKITRFDKQSGKIVQAGTALGTGANLPGVDDILYILFKQSAVDLTNKNGQATFNNATAGGVGSGPAPAVVDFFTDFANPARDTYAWNDTMPNALDAFINGQVAFFFGYSYHLPIIKTRAPQLNYGIIPMLQLNPDSRVNVANYWIQSVVGKSQHINEAWDLILFLTSSDATKEYLKATGRPTALRPLISEQVKDVDLAPFVQDALVSENWYRGNNYDAALKALQDMVKDWLSIPPNADHPENFRQNALDRAAQKINQTL